MFSLHWSQLYQGYALYKLPETVMILLQKDNVDALKSGQSAATLLLKAAFSFLNLGHNHPKNIWHFLQKNIQRKCKNL